LTPEQERTRERFERLIGRIAPALDFVLAAGDRVSRRFARSRGPEYRPARIEEKKAD
jgi:hypothetical protein